MGAWSHKIGGNDIYQDVYQRFFDLYNEGQDPKEISDRIKLEFVSGLNDDDDRNNVLFALAQAQWDTKSLAPEIFDQISQIVVEGRDIELWKKLGANEKTLKLREAVLSKFFHQLSTGRLKPKRRVRKKFEYKGIEVLHLNSPDGKKRFEIVESYVNGVYQDTCSRVCCETGGGAVFNFNEQRKSVSARWLNNQILEIKHDTTINFSRKKENFFYPGDEGIITYIAVPVIEEQ